MNLQFHLAYQFLSRVQFAIYDHIETENSGIKTPAKKIFRIFSWIIMIMSAIGSCRIYDVHYFTSSIRTIDCINDFIAVFLGGYSFNLKLRKD